MSATTLPPARNSHEQSLVEYRSISKLALATLGMGLGSALVLVSPLLALIPLLTVAGAILSLRTIQRSGGQVVGRTPAVIGLCLATFFLGWGVAARFSRATTLEARAQEFAEAWLRLVAEGDLEQADQLRVPARNRVLSAAGRKEFYQKNPDLAKGKVDFFGTPAFRDLIAQGKNVRIQFEGLEGVERSTFVDRLMLRYSFGDPQPGPRNRLLIITVKRDRHERQADWIVEGAEGPDGPAS
jgi:hypothetical protein